MRDDPRVIELVARAADGDQAAWNELVERYASLVWSICLKYRLDRSDIDDVGQSVWLLLVEKIASIREPAALPGWLATTTHRECLRVLRSAHRHDHAEMSSMDELPSGTVEATIEQEILAAEVYAAVRAAFAELPRGCRELLSMLIGEPPRAYTEVSAALDVAVGSIGPKRARCLARLRRSPHLTAIIDSGAWDVGVEQARSERDD